jgi:hypothetical protein
MEKTFPGHRWKVGDLIQHKTYARCLLVHVEVKDFNVYDFISQTGYQFQMTEPHGFLHNTGLKYNYVTDRAVRYDFSQGLFKPYFNILY